MSRPSSQKVKALNTNAVPTWHVAIRRRQQMVRTTASSLLAPIVTPCSQARARRPRLKPT
eukprot:scaffold281001_cov51-Prasinocladus_malaysianus.AAC.3